MTQSRGLVIQANSGAKPYATLLALNASGFSIDKTVSFSEQQLLLNLDGERLTNDISIARLIIQSGKNNEEFLGKDISEFAKIDEVVNVCESVVDGYLSPDVLEELEVVAQLPNRTTLADIAIFALVVGNEKLKAKFSKNFEKVLNDSKFHSAHASVGMFKTEAPAKSQQKPKEKQKDEGKFIELPGAEKGKVVVRFPPEASGYLHIGHAKAALLNQYYQQAFDGVLIMRFDDTNPAKENSHFEQVIKEDLAMLNIVPDRWTHSSDYFETMLEFCEKLLAEGKAYVDDTDTETMRKEREERVESRNRNNEPAKNLALWKEMKNGTENGQKCCVRLKIDMKSNNGAMRDPTIYRCKPEEHVRTGLKYKVYPTYDFACPIVDSIEGVTHTLRTTEYHDRDDQFYFICDALGLRRPYIWEYARLNMTNTVMSKRKLTWFVDEGHVEGWDDPRLPTVRGVMRRGLTVEGLKQFIVAQGGSRSVVMMEWDKIWAFNKKVIDPVAPRYTALENSSPLVSVELDDQVAEESVSVPLHPKNAEVGSKDIFKGKILLLEQNDAKEVKVGDTVTFVNWGNIKIVDVKSENGVIKTIKAKLDLENKDYKKTLKVTWLGKVGVAEGKDIPVVTADYDHIISKAIIGKDEDWKNFINYDSVHFTKMMGEPALKTLKKGDIIQLQRKGYYIVDHAYQAKSDFIGTETPLLLISIPDGHVKEVAAPADKEKGKSNSTNVKGSGNEAVELHSKIEQQGTLVRQLKEKDAKGQATKDAIAALLELKKQFKQLTGAEFKPGSPPTVSTPASEASSSNGALDLYNAIEKQGNTVRDLKAKDAKSQETKDAIAKLLDLKKQYKAATGSDHKPGAPPAAAPAPITSTPSASGGALDLYNAIEKQGNTVRDLKAKDAKSQETKDAIAKLLDLKKQYKAATGADHKPGVPPTSAPASATSTPYASGGALDLYNAIEKQGNTVRDLKAKDSKSQETKDAIAKLLDLKKQYKALTGSDHKPGSPPAGSSPAPAAAATVPAGNGALDLYNAVEQQGNTVRELKSKDAKSQETKDAIAKLLDLKKQYKALTGTDHKPGSPPAAPAASTPSASGGSSTDLYDAIEQHGNTVRELKAKDAKSQETKDAIAKLLELKKQYKEKHGQDYKPGAPPAVSGLVSAASVTVDVAGEIQKKIEEQGNKVRELKSKDAQAQATKDAIAALLSLKLEYKEKVGSEYKPGAAPAAAAKKKSEEVEPLTAKRLTEEIEAQGNLVRELKAANPKSAEAADAIKKLLELKGEYKKVTGKDFPAAASGNKKPGKEAPKKSEKKAEKKAEQPKDDSDNKKTKLGIEVAKNDNYSEWYSQVITKAEMIEYYDVSGCYVLRPWSFAIWEIIKKWFDTRIKRLGVKNCYFPIFVSQGALEREKEHIADFAPEVAWVTRAGSSEMAEPIAIRPTSETVMYPSYKKWIQSHRDLPLRLNQWCNIVRWEFKHPTPFLRTREFLWQEGHTAYSNPQDAEKEVFQILDLYSGVYQDLMAIPVIKGRKSEKEKFAGGVFTTTIEAYVPVNGRGVQAATSHHLGQNFSKMFDISFEDSTGQRSLAWQNSWGLTTRTIGAMVMVHGDDTGLVLPPRVAAVQAIVLPVGITASTKPEGREAIANAVSKVAADLVAEDVRAEADQRDNYSPGWKFNYWELKGVPIRIEVGPKDLAAGQVTVAIRYNGEKRTLKNENLPGQIKDLLDEIHNAMFEKVKKLRDDHMKIVYDMNEFCDLLNQKFILLAPFCGAPSCEEKIKRDSVREDGHDGAQMGAKSLCIPLEQPSELLGEKCLHSECTAKPVSFALFGRSY